MESYRRFAWFTLGFCVLVIVWGAFVRATGSGAGCGAHWPLCNGTAMPVFEQRKTLIEFSHRLTSGLSLVFVIALYVWTKRLFARGSFQRRAAGLSFVAIVIEALIGAGIVLLRLVEHDQSLDRAISIALHLVNTLFLVAALTVTAMAPREDKPRWRHPDKGERWWVRALVVGFALLGGLGALTALGDTLFPVANLSQEWRDKFDPEARRHFLQQIRVIHPLVAVLWAGAAIWWVSLVWERSPGLKKRGGQLTALVVGQILFGIANIAFLAPVWMQLVHLLWANLIWIYFVSIAFSGASRWRPAAFSSTS